MPNKGDNSIWQMNYFSRNSTCMILYIALDEYTHIPISKYEQFKETCLEAVICQHLGWSYWATPPEACPRT